MTPSSDLRSADRRPNVERLGRVVWSKQLTLMTGWAASGGRHRQTSGCAALGNGRHRPRDRADGSGGAARGGPYLVTGDSKRILPG